MIEYSVSQSNDDLIVTILEGNYKSVVSKIVDLKFDNDGTPSFELELPTTKTELFNDEQFIKEIQNIVGDVLKKSIDFMWNSQEELITINDKMCDLLINKKISVSKDYTEIERCMTKGFLLKLDENKENVIAIDMKENKEYYLSNEDDFNYIRKMVYTNIELN